MTKDEAIKMAKAKLECLERETSGLWNCNNDCENCNLNYDQGNIGEQKEWLKFAIKTMEQGPVYFPPCVDFNTKMNEIREAYDKLKKQEPCEDAVSRKAVFEAIDDCNSDGLKGIFCSYDDGERFKNYIKNLPPVTPTCKHGEWEEETFDLGANLPVRVAYQCSECGNYFDLEFNFCPHCGAEMRGSRE